MSWRDVGTHRARNLYNGERWVGTCFDEKDAKEIVQALNLVEEAGPTLEVVIRRLEEQTNLTEALRHQVGMASALFTRAVISRVSLVDGGEEVKLDCGHTVIRIIPQPEDRYLYCAECLDKYVSSRKQT